MRKVITAKYKSKCYECGDVIVPGDDIVWDCDDRNAVWHLDCDRAAQPPATTTAIEDFSDYDVQ